MNKSETRPVPLEEQYGPKTTKDPESTANMTPQGLIFLVGWDKMSIHYRINLHPNPSAPILLPLTLYPFLLHPFNPHPPTRASASIDSQHWDNWLTRGPNQVLATKAVREGC